MTRFKTTKVDVPMTFEHLLIFLKFRFSISIAITKTYLCTCMKFAMCDGQTDTRTDAQTDGHKGRHNEHCSPKESNDAIQYMSGR